MVSDAWSSRWSSSHSSSARCAGGPATGARACSKTARASPVGRCTKRGAAVDLCLSFQGALGDEITARDIMLFCDECCESSEFAQEFAHFAHMLNKD